MSTPGHTYNLRSSSRLHLSTNPPSSSRPNTTVVMATVDDALDVAKYTAAAAMGCSRSHRFGRWESAGDYPPIEPNHLTVTAADTGWRRCWQQWRRFGRRWRQRRRFDWWWCYRRIDPSCLDKLHGDESLSQFRSWRNRWNDFCQMSQLSTYPASEQMAAFRMVLDQAMQ